METNIPPEAGTQLCGGLSCAAEAAPALELLGGRWAFALLEALHLAGGRSRFRDLQRRVGGISQKELARNLSQLAGAGVVRRLSLDGPPRQVLYELTARGLALLQRASLLAEWSRAAVPARGDAQVTASWLDPLPRWL